MFTSLLVQGGLFIGAMVVLLLVFNIRRNWNNIFLAVSLLMSWYALLITVLNSSQAMLNYPYLFRTGNIAGYLIFPLLYLYAKSSFYPGSVTLKKYWWVLIPALVYIADLSPFFMAPLADKMTIIKNNLESSRQFFKVAEGSLLPSGVHFICIYTWCLLFCILQVKVIVQNFPIWKEEGKTQNRSLYFFIAMITVLYFPIIFPSIFGVIFHLPWYSLNFLNISIAISLLSAAVYLLLSPGILYGFYPKISLKKLRSPQPDAGIEFKNDSAQVQQKEVFTEKRNHRLTEKDGPDEKQLSSEKMKQLIEETECFLVQSKNFTKVGYSINDLSKDTGIPVYQLSPLINSVYNVNFNNWINRYRINYFLEIYHSEENHNLTLEALGEKVGFKSRTTFINAFKKEKGTPPRLFIAALNEGG